MATKSKPTVYDCTIQHKPSGGYTVYVFETSEAREYGHPLYLSEEEAAVGATPLFPSAEVAHEAYMKWRAAQLAKVGYAHPTPIAKPTTTGEKGASNG